MPKREYAATGKLKRYEYEAILRGQPERVKSVCDKSIYNVRKGISWKDGWYPKRYDDKAEHKACRYCGKLFGRRYKSGRLITPANFKKKQCCNQRCNVAYLWMIGAFDNRPGRGPGRKNLPCNQSQEASPPSSSSAQLSMALEET